MGWYGGAGIDTTNDNPAGTLFINGGVGINDSHWFGIDGDSGFAEILTLISGVPQPASLLIGSNTLWLDHNVGISRVGHHLATKSIDGHLHYFSHSESNGQISTHDAQILDEYNFEPRRIYQPDDSTTFTGQNIEFSFLSDAHVKTQNIYYKTGSTVPTTPVRIQIWEGTDDTGNRVFNQYYPHSDFIADSEIQLKYNGFVEYDEGQTYFLRYSCDTDFSLKADATTTYLWFAADVSDVRPDDMLQIRSYDSRNDGTYIFNESGNIDWTIQNRKIYSCNTTGTQTGTFASNIAKWDELGSSSEHYWELDGTTLKNRVGPSAIELISPTVTLKPAAAARMQLILNNLGMTYQGDTGYQMVMGLAQTTLYSPDGLMMADVGNQAITLGKDSGVQFKADIGAGISMFSPGRAKSLSITDGIIDAQTTYFNIGDGTRTRFQSKATDISMWSPDGTSIVAVKNTGTEITGQVDLALGEQGKGVWIHPYSNQYSGGSLTWVGALNGGVKYSNYSMDNFWGYLRIYTSAEQTKYIQIQNVADTDRDMYVGINVPSGNPAAVIDANGTTWNNKVATVNSKFQYKHNAGGYPNIVLGGTSTTVGAIFEKSVSASHFYYGDDTDTGGHVFRGGLFTVRKGTQDRVRVNFQETELISPAEVYSLIVRDDYVHIWDGFKNRFTLNNTDTILTSADGDQNLQVTNTIVKVSEDFEVANWANIGTGIVLTGMTTTERDALTGVNGMIIHNSTTGQIQAFAGGAWTVL